MSKSSKQKFEIVSPDVPLIKELHKLIGKQVSYASQKNIIPQLYLLSNLHFMIQIQRNLHIIKLHKILGIGSDLLPTVLQIHLENYKTYQDLVSQFVKQKAVFHKTCTNKHDSYNVKLEVKTKKN